MPAETVSDNVETLINLALAEDFGSGDVTSTYFVPEHLTARAILTPRKKGVLSGVNVAAEVFRKVDPTLKVEVYLHDGEAVAPGAVVMLIEGSARSILLCPTLLRKPALTSRSASLKVQKTFSLSLNRKFSISVFSIFI